MALSRNHKIPEDKQVLLTHDGRLLENHRMIGEYGVGTVSVVCVKLIQCLVNNISSKNFWYFVEV